jgi:hypothetical protein
MSEPQQIINVGQVANDGTGESLRDAFNAVNNNFANVWTAGPVNSQVVISNNKITTDVTNLDLVLAGNGVGNVTLSSTTVPSIDSVYDLGSPTRYFDSLYARYLVSNYASVNGNITSTGNVTGQFFFGNGYFLTGIAGGASNINLNNVQSNILPASNVFSLGNVGNQWNTAWIANTLYLKSIPLTISGGNLVVNNATVVTNGGSPTFTGVSVSGNTVTTALYTDNYYYANGAPFPQGANSIPGTTISLKDNVISTTIINQNLIISANGIGAIQSNSSIIPSIDSVYDLGSSAKQFDEVHAQYYYGNGAFLTGISGGGNTNYSNANVAAYLPTYTGNLVSLTGPVVTTANVTGGNIRTGGTVSATGNITGANVIAALHTGNTVSVTGNIASANLNLSGNLSIAGNVNSALTVRANISGTNVITGGNAFATYFIGNGSQLTGIVVSGGSAINNGNSNVTIGSANANVTVSVNNVSNVAVFTQTGMSVAGNVIATNFIGNVIGNISGNLTVPGANTEVLFNNNGVVGTANAFTFNSATSVLSVNGNVVAGNFVGNGQALSSVMADRGGDSNNWNTLMQMGTYTVNRTSWSGTSGTPLDSQVFVGLLQVSNSTNTAIEQVFFPGTVENGNVKIQWNRAYWSGTWTGWVKIVNDFQVVTGGEF